MLLLTEITLFLPTASSFVANLGRLIDGDDDSGVSVIHSNLTLTFDLQASTTVGAVRLKTDEYSALDAIVVSTSPNGVNYLEAGRIDVDDQAWQIVDFDNLSAEYIQVQLTGTGAYNLFVVQAFDLEAKVEDPKNHHLEYPAGDDGGRRGDGRYVPNDPVSVLPIYVFDFRRLPKAQLDAILGLLRTDVKVIASELWHRGRLVTGRFEPNVGYEPAIFDWGYGYNATLRLQALDGIDAPSSEPTAASIRILSGQKQTQAGGTQLDPFVVEVRDQNGMPLPNATVNFAITMGRGVLSQMRVVTDANGRASTRLTFAANPA